MLLEAPDDFLLTLDLPLLAFIFPEFVRFPKPFFFGIGGVIAFICNKLMVLDLKDPGRRLIQKISVMGNDGRWFPSSSSGIVPAISACRCPDDSSARPKAAYPVFSKAGPRGPVLYVLRRLKSRSSCQKNSSGNAMLFSIP